MCDGFLAGLGGGAARVVMSKSQPAEAVTAVPEDSAAEPSSSGEKRKAEAEAQAALAKRRPLPELEVAALVSQDCHVHT